MAGSSLLMLIDDIATMLDDVAVLSKVAAKKTAGVLGDDLALNAEQVSGVKANRELPVVWAVTKGSFVNKLILVPSALAISAFAPSLITWLLIIGGLFLCFEGAEKVTEKLLQRRHQLTQHHAESLSVTRVDERLGVTALEKQKIKGAIRTDFVLSAEIIVIILGSVQQAPFETQVMVVSGLAVLFTVGVYGLVAGIVKLDDLGLYLLRQSVSGSYNAIQRFFGRLLLILAPKLMKLLTIVGTAAMFLVGGGILAHGLHGLHELLQHAHLFLTQYLSGVVLSLSSLLMEGLLGLIAGAIVLLMVNCYQHIMATKSN